MSHAPLPLIIEPAQLEQALADENMLVIDLCAPEIYAQAHIPGAIHLDYDDIVAHVPPAMGLAPPPRNLQGLFSKLGITRDTQVVAYDDAGGGKAGRLLWTLEAAGFHNGSLLNGGLQAWSNEGHPLERQPNTPKAAPFVFHNNPTVVATRQQVLERLGDRSVAILDARSPGEFDGSDVRARRGGHIPGAVNLEWTRLHDPTRNMRLKSPEQLKALFESHGFTPDKEIIVYCHTHHRSALVYVALKSLSYDKVRGYPGSWSDWGNRADTPIEQ